MADTNHVCSLCQSLPASLTCFCEFPLPLLCPSCIHKHTPSFLPHYPFPLRIQPYVTMDNYMECKEWLLRLNQAHLNLRKGVTKLNDIEEALEAVWREVDEEIAEMKRRYRAAVQQLKADVSQMVEAAIAETTEYAFNKSHQYVSPIGDWVRSSKKLRNLEDSMLYETRVKTGEIEKIIDVELKAKWPSLPQFPTYIGKPQRKMPAISGAICRISIVPSRWNSDLREEKRAIFSTVDLFEPGEQQEEEAAYSLRYSPVKPDPRPPGRTNSCGHIRPTRDLSFSPQIDYSRKPLIPEAPSSIDSSPFKASFTPVIIEESLIRASQCRVCLAKFTPADFNYHCSSSCRCKRCAVEALSGSNVCICKLCRREIPAEVIALVNRETQRCHVCGIAVENREMERAASCNICCKCVTIVVNSKVSEGQRRKGHCRLCRDVFFNINEEVYREIKLKWLNSACCGGNGKGDERLQCGHFVCKTHKEHLKSCRVCQIGLNQSPSRRK